MEKPNKLKGGDKWMGRKSGAGPLGPSTLGLEGRPWVAGGSGPGLPLGLKGQGLGPGEAQPQGQGVLWPQVLWGAASSPP